MIHDRCWRRSSSTVPAFAAVHCGDCWLAAGLWRGEAAVCLALLLMHPVSCSVLGPAYVQNTVHCSTCMYQCHCRTASGKHGQLLETCAEFVQAGIKSRCACRPVTSRLDPIRSGHTHTHTHASHRPDPAAPCPPHASAVALHVCSHPSRSRAAQGTVPRSRHKREMACRRQQIASPRKHRNPPPPAPRSLPVTWPRGEWADFPATARFSAAIPCHPGAADSARF